MPMDRKLYPKNWNAIALEVKAEAFWVCQECGRPCRLPGESIGDFVDRLTLEDLHLLEDGIDDEFGTPIYKWGRATLTVAHLDHNPANNDPSNLKALCSVCHLQHDASHHANSRRANKKRQLEQAGQLRLVGL